MHSQVKARYFAETEALMQLISYLERDLRGNTTVVDIVYISIQTHGIAQDFVNAFILKLLTSRYSEDLESLTRDYQYLMRGRILTYISFELRVGQRRYHIYTHNTVAWDNSLPHISSGRKREIAMSLFFPLAKGIPVIPKREPLQQELIDACINMAAEDSKAMGLGKDIKLPSDMKKMLREVAMYGGTND